MAPGSPIIFKNEITDPFKSNEDQSLQSSSREFIINFIKAMLKKFSNGMEKCLIYFLNDDFSELSSVDI